jgi:hypothetical protein
MTQIELAAYVNEHLHKAGIRMVLSGGAAVSYRCNNRYVSIDIDLVNEFSVRHKKIKDSLNEIGFTEEGRHFKHPESQWVIEFPPGPLTVGTEPVKHVEEVKFDTGVLRIISATDCVKDRLAAYYHWGDEQCLQQAIWVTQSSTVDLREIERWSVNEGKEPEFRIFLKRI